eukprot:TRINITY_DN1486_c0_g1_i1.p1 TRINITY_DN1486_c0_g1~~TRINITY_DN1486_c0_g1_i1.p1  ORF type:complete len:175 (+),score=51.55 TRINITY_DN1486_c0_g1_i1:55-525(+)
MSLKGSVKEIAKGFDEKEISEREKEEIEAKRSIERTRKAQQEAERAEKEAAERAELEAAEEAKLEAEKRRAEAEAQKPANTNTKSEPLMAAEEAIEKSSTNSRPPAFEDPAVKIVCLCAAVSLVQEGPRSVRYLVGALSGLVIAESLFKSCIARKN